MIATTALVDSGSSPHLAGRDEEDVVLQSARLDVFDERGDGVIERSPDRFHPVDHVQIVAVGVHVPDAGVPRVDRHEPASGFAQAPGE